MIDPADVSPEEQAYNELRARIAELEAERDILKERIATLHEMISSEPREETALQSMYNAQCELTDELIAERDGLREENKHLATGWLNAIFSGIAPEVQETIILERLQALNNSKGGDNDG